MENLETKIAKDLLSIEAIFLKPDDPFTWASGIKSPIYCDNRLTLTSPMVRNDVEEGLASLIQENFPGAEVLMGTSTAGIAHAAITADILGLPMGYVRGSSKDHGRKNQIEGQINKRTKSCRCRRFNFNWRKCYRSYKCIKRSRCNCIRYC